jgi:hypothetical protein
VTVQLVRPYTERFRDALEAAGITGYIGPFHERHAAHRVDELRRGDCQPGRAHGDRGHRSFATTKGYLQLAGIAFADEAAQLEQRLYGGRKFYPSESTSADSGDVNGSESRIPA